MSNKKKDQGNHLSNSSQNFVHNKLNSNKNISTGKPLMNSMNDFIDKRNKINNNENINNNMLSNNYLTRTPLVEDIYGNNFEYIKHNSNTFLSNNNFNNRNLNNNKVNKAAYAINYNNNANNSGYNNNIMKNKPLNNFNPNLIHKNGPPPQTGHPLINRNKNNKNNPEEGPVKIKENNYSKNGNNINEFNTRSTKKPTTPDLNRYNSAITAGFLSEKNNNFNPGNSISKTNNSSIMVGRGNSLKKSDKSNSIFGYGSKTNFKHKFSIKRPATAPHKDKVKVPSGLLNNKKNIGISGDKKQKIGKFNQRPQSAEGKNKNIYKNYNTPNNNYNTNGMMRFNKNYNIASMSGIINSNKKNVNNMKNNLQNKGINSPLHNVNSYVNNKNLFNGSKYNINPKYRMPSPVIKPTNNIQRKNVVGNNGVKIDTSKNFNMNFK